jgi:hypothetical protein
VSKHWSFFFGILPAYRHVENYRQSSHRNSSTENMIMTFIKNSAAALFALALGSSIAQGQDTRVYWGDTHVHTGDSFDVYLFGTLDSTPDTAIRFARGETVSSPTTAQKMQLSQPLDFVVVADHAEAVGSIPRLFKGDPNFTETKTGQILLKLAPEQTPDQLIAVYKILAQSGSGLGNDYGLTPEDIYNDLHGGDKRLGTWNDYIDTVEKYNKPGEFTALVGWEWSSQPKGGNMHRVVFTPAGPETTRKFLPYSSLESQDPEDLWAWLETTSQETGAKFIAIPHNSNLSMGQMFSETTQSGKPLSADYARTRNKWEKAIEIVQIKGDSETHPLLSPVDEYADFETFEFVLIPGGGTPDPTEADYVRSGLKRGLEVGATTGENPFKMGVIGSTDSHTGMSSVEENNFGGKGQHDAEPAQRSHLTGIGDSRGWDMGAAGFAGVWATDNTREAIYDAFQRKEVYASSGPRISLRFFGGYDFAAGDAQKPDLAAVGYAKGVPMGGDLLASKDRAPQFLVAASKDPDAANLDRIQIVKGWLDGDGNAQEQVCDVALSGKRKDGSAPVGNTVDLKTATYSNSIGEAALAVVWSDPDFEPSQNAFYYARVLEIPTPRYSLMDAVALGIDPKDTGRPLTIQERVYSSAIWYTATN